MEKYQFLNAEHKKTFQELREQLADHYRFDKEYLTICFMMAGCAELQHKMSKYFDGVEGNLLSEEMFHEQDFSSGIHVLAKLAINLFNNNEKVSPSEFISSLDDELFNLAVNSILFRKYGISRDYAIGSE